MAQSGSKTVTVTAQHKLKFSWELSSQSIANNTSTITWKMELISSGGTISSSASKAWSATVAGTKYSGSNTVGIAANATKSLASGSTTINHASDGSKTFNYSFSQEFGINYSGSTVGTKTGSGSGTLPTIDRKSTVTATNATVGSNSTITITRANSNFKHNLAYKIDGKSDWDLIVSKTTATSYSWTIPNIAYDYMTNGKVTITIRCKTFSGDTEIGSNTTTITASAQAASTVNATNATVGSNSTITITRANSSFKHTIQYKINGTTIATISEKTANTSVSWTVPTSIYSYIPSNSKTISVGIYCYTYYNDLYIGNNYKTITVSCNESACKPTLSPTVVDVGSVSVAVTGDSNKMIKGYNCMTCTFNDAARNGATITSRKVTCGSQTLNANGTLWHCESDSFVFTVTDSRGYTTTQTVKKTLINYISTSCSLNANATLETGSTETTTAKLVYTIYGNYFNSAVGATTNKLYVWYRWKTNDGSWSSWIAVTPTISGNSYRCDGYIGGLSYNDSFTIEACACDELYYKGATGKIYYSPARTVKAEPVFDWSKTDFNFNVPVSIPSSKYFSINAQSGGGLNLNNSDVIGANSIYFNDQSDAVAEGLGFPTDDNKETYDYLKARGGILQFIPKYPTNTAVMSLTENTILWEGYIYMNGEQGIDLNGAISAQPHGAVLCWSYYSSSTPQNYNFTYQFIPKTHISKHAGVGIMFSNPYLGLNKYLYVRDTRITGNAQNGTSGTMNGIAYDNTKYVLRYVIGV